MTGLNWNLGLWKTDPYESIDQNRKQGSVTSC